MARTPEEIQFDIGEVLRRIRKSHGLTQGALAKRLNVGQTTVSAWERGRGVPDLRALTRLRLLADSKDYVDLLRWMRELDPDFPDELPQTAAEQSFPYLQMPTGSGKTATAASLYNNLYRTQMNVLVMRLTALEERTQDKADKALLRLANVESDLSAVVAYMAGGAKDDWEEAFGRLHDALETLAELRADLRSLVEPTDHEHRLIRNRLAHGLDRYGYTMQDEIDRSRADYGSLINDED